MQLDYDALLVLEIGDGTPSMIVTPAVTAE
jgi:hypothetical protein